MSRFTYNETDAIREARKLFPNDGQRTLARRLVGQEDFPKDYYYLKAILDKRGYASIYGAIRRFDAQHTRSSDRATNPDIRERHADALRRLDLRPGDKVRVERQFDTFADGWKNSWAHGMTRAVGKTGTVEQTHPDNGVRLRFEPDLISNGSGLQFPAQVLTVVERAGHRQPQTA